LTPVRLLERLSQTLALDENLIGLAARGSGTSDALSTRLRTMLDRTERSTGTLTPSTVARLAEAAWVISRQVELESRLGVSADSALAQIKPVPVEPGPSYRQGYALAQETRRVLGLGDEEPIESMRALLGEKVGIPLLTVELGQRVAGATLANGARRGIVVNASRPTKNPWIRRITAAHELCHYLWDPDTDLAALRVDTTDTVDFGTKPTDLVEQRANAFAVEFLAPQKGLRRLAANAASRDEALEAISGHFGISARAASYHLQNAHLTRRELFGEGYPAIQPEDKWRAEEDFDLDWFPIKSVAYARRGRFANLVALAVERGRITADSGAVLLAVPLEEFKRGLKSILGLGKRADGVG
jgi:Zn-dependent peptidase ImmA (M78 family)